MFTASISTPAVAPASSAVPDVRARTVAKSGAHVTLWRPDAIAVVTILVVTGVVAWQRLWLQNGLAHFDISTFYLPWYAYMGEHLRHFDIPGWNPHVFSGTAFAGDPQSGWMYLPAMVFFTLFDSVRAYQAFLIFHLALAGLGTFVYARVLGLRTVAALAAAFAYEFGPLVNHISCCVIHVQLAVWIPIALLGVELMMRTANWSGRAAAWVLTGFAVSQMLAGWTGQGSYNGLLVVAGAIVFRTLFTAVAGVVTRRERFVRMVIDGAGTTLLGFGLGAAGLLPRLDVVNHTNLAGGQYSGHETDTYSSGWPLMMFLDRMLSDDNGFLSLTFYFGAPVLALMVVAPYLGRTRYRMPFFLAVTAFASVMTLRETLFHAVVYTLLPKFEMLHSHVPSRILAIQWIGPAMLAGIAVELLLQERDRERIKRAAIVALAAWGAGTVVLIAWQSGITLTTILLALVTAAVIAAFALPAVWGRRTNNGRASTAQLALGLLLVLLVFLDPAGRGLANTILTDQQNALLAVPTGAIPRDAVPINAATTDPGGAGGFFQALQNQGEIFRYFGYDYALTQAGAGYPSTYREYYWLPEAQDLLVNARAMPLGLDDVQGYNPMQLSDYITAILFANHDVQNYHDSQIMPAGLDSPILDMLNVRYIVIPNALAAGRPRPDIMQLLATHREVFRNDSIRILENERALPRAWSVHTAYATSDKFGLLMIDAGLVDPGQVVFLGAQIDPPALGDASAANPDVVTVTTNNADTVELSATMASDGLVVVSQTYDTDWQAYVDGKRVELYRANGVLQAVPVPAGTHTIRLVYAPRSLQLGLILSWTSLAISGAILAAWVWSRFGLPTPRRRRMLAEPA